jgi:hypothetical protein
LNEKKMNLQESNARYNVTKNLLDTE